MAFTWERTVMEPSKGIGRDAGAYARRLYDSWVARDVNDRRRSVAGLARLTGIGQDTLYSMFKGESDTTVTVIVRFLTTIEASGDQVRTFFELMDTPKGRQRFKVWDDSGAPVLPPDAPQMVDFLLNDLPDSPGVTDDIRERATRVARWLSKALARSSST